MAERRRSCKCVSGPEGQYGNGYGEMHEARRVAGRAARDPTPTESMQGRPPIHDHREPCNMIAHIEKINNRSESTIDSQ